MSNDLKKSALPYLGLFGVAAVICALGRAGLAAMDVTGAFSYNYRTATAPYLTEGLSTLDKLCMVSTGGTLVGFIFAGGLALCLAVASAMLFSYVFDGEGEGGMGVALVWGFATAIVSFACLVVTVLGLFSRVQLSQMASSGGGSLGVLVVLLFLCVGTLVAAASTVLRAATRRGSTTGKNVLWTILLALVCGAVVCVLTVGAFGAINAVPSDTGTMVGWLVAAVVCNCIMLFVGSRLGSR
ncbi:MAG: hypothetical protein IJ131_03780 [Eggerthellaceae bacterium]|nr:hypothetical protein [Eggerthellaceae bacterium]